jgi:ergothioneine biosynthesis protein EgtB
LNSPEENMTSATANSATTLSLAEQYRRVRRFTEQIAEPLSDEDCMVQSMPDVSPTRWHMAHTTWFFETFVLKKQPGYEVYDESFSYLFNSYYNAVGTQFPRPQRGLISRPGLQTIKNYRRYVDEQMKSMLSAANLPPEVSSTVLIGIHHEQQHQELMLTDIKHVLSCNPTLPIYQSGTITAPQESALHWFEFDAGVETVGLDGDEFAFDNERPSHQTYLADFSMAGRPVSCGEYIDFISDGGYRRPEHWLSLGWMQVQEQAWDAPLYWVQRDGEWMVFTLAGLLPVNPNWPVCHVSYFEADAFARWSGHRLPTEFEWEVASRQGSGTQFADRLFAQQLAIHPLGEDCTADSLSQMFGSVWEWTSSSYSAYPGYSPPDGALGEYNGKFMCNQYVLRGGSVATSRDHVRPTYRNFFPPSARWQFSGLRLAR